MAALRPPHVLVLGGRGILGEAWMSAALAGLEDALHFDARRCDGGADLMDPGPRSRVIAAGPAQGRAARADARG